MILITKRKVVAQIGGHSIYHLEEYRVLPVTSPLARLEKRADEQRYLQIFMSIDLAKNFYFSYTYNLTRTLQYNLTKFPECPAGKARRKSSYFDWNNMVVWNHYLLSNGFGAEMIKSEWCLPIIHGFVDQASCVFPLLSSFLEFVIG